MRRGLGMWNSDYITEQAIVYSQKLYQEHIPSKQCFLYQLSLSVI